jgi:biopolymer transport protein ExbB/biopolymer transport protein TolQ
MTRNDKERLMSIAELFGSMGVIGLCVMVCLVALSVYSVAVIFDKFRRFRAAAVESQAFVPAFDRCLRDGKLKDAAATAREHGRSHVARVVSAGFNELADARNHPGDPQTKVELVSRALERTTARTLADMKKGLGSLATIGSTAPFIGLFGTIVGIVHAFQGIAESGSGGVAAVSGGIAEALIATALGILVAIPAVMGFNYFVATLERFHVEMDTTSAELVDFMLKKAKATHAA